MNVCACGQPMELGQPWCRRCWARWSAWYMRARGRWIDLEHGFLMQSRPMDGSENCSCLACVNHRMLQKIADHNETMRRDRLWQHLHEPHDS